MLRGVAHGGTRGDVARRVKAHLKKGGSRASSARAAAAAASAAPASAAPAAAAPAPPAVALVAAAGLRAGERPRDRAVENRKPRAGSSGLPRTVGF